jgi:uncharacterized membrane protein
MNAKATKTFSKQLPHDALVQAIRRAEEKSSGHIHVYISHRPAPDAMAAARKHFMRLRLIRYIELIGVLIFVAPRSNNFAVVGDEAVHALCGDAFWEDLARTMSNYFREQHFGEGILHAVEKTGDLLAVHFPPGK